jgi:hypothetical protein
LFIPKVGQSVATACALAHIDVNVAKAAGMSIEAARRAKDVMFKWHLGN